MNTTKPTAHTDFPMNSEVRIKTPYYMGAKINSGKIIGIAAMGWIYTYIVLLPEPISFVGDVMDGAQALAVPGTHLEYFDKVP